MLKQPYEAVLNTVEVIQLLNEIVQRFPYELNIKNWDAIRIGLSSWVLTISKSIKHYSDPKVRIINIQKYIKLFRLFSISADILLYCGCLPTICYAGNLYTLGEAKELNGNAKECD